MTAHQPTPDEQRIIEAWEDPGVAPWYHEMVKARFIEQWPSLALAIQQLSLNTRLRNTEEPDAAA